MFYAVVTIQIDLLSHIEYVLKKSQTYLVDVVIQRVKCDGVNKDRSGL